MYNLSSEYPNVMVGENVTIGENCNIFQEYLLITTQLLEIMLLSIQMQLLVQTDLDFYKDNNLWCKIPHIGSVIIEDNVEIGSNSTIDRGLIDCTQLMNNCKIDNLVHIAHNVTIGSNTAIAGCTGIAGSTTIEITVQLVEV